MDAMLPGPRTGLMARWLFLAGQPASQTPMQLQPDPSPLGTTAATWQGCHRQ